MPICLLISDLIDAASIQVQRYLRLPLAFEREGGAGDDRFLARSQSYTAQLDRGKATLELDGPHSPQGTANRSPEFYIRLSEEERFGIVRMGERKGNRVVEKLTIQPVINETTQEPDLVEVFRQQVGDQLFKIWPQKPLDPGEYAVVQYSVEKVDMQVWDFFIAPGTSQ